MIIPSSALVDADPASSQSAEETLTVLFPLEHRTAGFLQLQIALLKDEDPLELLRRVKDAVDESASAIWNTAGAEIAFWNFVYKLPSTQDSMTQDDRKWARDVMGYLRARVRTTSSPGKMTSAVLRACFPQEIQKKIDLLRDALEENDVDTIFDCGPACLEISEKLETAVVSLQAWLRRQFVLMALDMASWDYQGRLAAQLSHWIEALDAVTYAYETWLEQFDDDDLTDQGPPLTAVDPAVYEEVQTLATKELPGSETAVDFNTVIAPPEYIMIGDITCSDLTTSINIFRPTNDGYFSTVHQGSLLCSDGRRELVAVKVINPRMLQPEVIDRRWKREMLVWYTLGHPNILPIYGVYIGLNDFPALVSPWCSDGSLPNYVKARRDGEYPVISLCLDLLEQVLNAVQYLHEQKPPIIHGDLKGANILVSRDGRLQLCDFGLSIIHAEYGSHSLQSTDATARGTVPFMSPELLLGEPSVYSDMWAVSCVFVEMFSGFVPYHDKPNAAGRILAIVTGELPKRPDGLSNELWDLISTNWNNESVQRLSARTMLDRIYTLRAQRLAGESEQYRSSGRSANSRGSVKVF